MGRLLTNVNPARVRPGQAGCGLLNCERDLVDLAGGVLENDIGEHGCIGLLRQVRAEADADVEGPVEAQVDGWAELVHRFAFQADAAAVAASSRALISESPLYQGRWVTWRRPVNVRVLQRTS